MRSAYLIVVLASVLIYPAAQPNLSSARDAAAQLPQLHSLLVNHRGQRVLEYYAKGHSATRLANIKSTSKSLIAALVGIAIDRRLIRDVREPIVRWFPELKKDTDPRKARITVEDLLTMRSGLESTSGDHYGRWVSSRNWVRYALNRPMVSDPGTTMEYSTGTSHLLSAILTKVSRKTTHQFATEVLARPLGFTLARWTRDPQGIYLGGNEMLMTAPQMMRFGEWWLHRGRAGTAQLLPERWTDTSCQPRTRSRWDPDREYGYGWWMQSFGRHRACFAWGFGGQYIMVFRDLDLVIVVTSSTAVSDERRGYRRQLFDLIEQHVLAPIAGR